MPLIAPEKTAGTVGITPANPAQPHKGQGKKAKDGQTRVQDNGNKGKTTAQQMWTGNGSTQFSQTTSVTPDDIRALQGQFAHKWAAPYIAAVVQADSILGKKFSRLSGSEDKIAEYRSHLSNSLSGEEKKALNEANTGSNFQSALHICSALAMSGMIKPVTLKVFFPKADSSDIALINDVRKVTGLGRVDQGQLESEGARS